MARHPSTDRNWGGSYHSSRDARRELLAALADDEMDEALEAWEDAR